MKLLLSSVVETLPEVWLFLEKLSASVKAGTIRSKEQLIERCQEFYTAERMAEIEAVIPGWKHMASFEHGKTLWHINVAMVSTTDTASAQQRTRGALCCSSDSQ